jgi:hypothetical protein
MQGRLLGELRAQAGERGAVGGDRRLLEIDLLHRATHLYGDPLHLPENLRPDVDVAMRLENAQGAYRVLDAGAAHGHGVDDLDRAEEAVPEEEGDRCDSDPSPKKSVAPSQGGDRDEAPGS